MPRSFRLQNLRDLVDRQMGQVLFNFSGELVRHCVVEMPTQFSERPRIGNDDQVANPSRKDLTVDEGGYRSREIVLAEP